VEAAVDMSPKTNEILQNGITLRTNAIRTNEPGRVTRLGLMGDFLVGGSFKMNESFLTKKLIGIHSG
jgi:hypothetical protein